MLPAIRQLNLIRWVWSICISAIRVLLGLFVIFGQILGFTTYMCHALRADCNYLVRTPLSETGDRLNSILRAVLAFKTLCLGQRNSPVSHTYCDQIAPGVAVLAEDSSLPLMARTKLSMLYAWKKFISMISMCESTSSSQDLGSPGPSSPPFSTSSFYLPSKSSSNIWKSLTCEVKTFETCLVMLKAKQNRSV